MKKFLSALALVAMTCSVQAALITNVWNFVDPNAPPAPFGATVAVLTVSGDDTLNSTNFSLEYLGSPYQTLPDSSFVFKMFFDGPGTTASGLTGPANGTVTRGSYNDSSDTFDWVAQFQTSNSGGGLGRLVENEIFSFDVNGNVAGFDPLNALLHVNAYNGRESIKLRPTPGGDTFGGGPCDLNPFLPECNNSNVPEPTSMALAGLGILGAGIVGRRRKLKVVSE